jgi:hypothetical protein
MRKQTLVILIITFMICLSSVTYADTLTKNTYRTFEGFHPDYGTLVWGIDHIYYADLIRYSVSKTVENHDVIAYAGIAQNPEYGGYPDYAMNNLKVYANSINVASYSSLGPVIRDYWIFPDHYYLYGGITNGTSMGNSSVGKIEVNFTIFANEWIFPRGKNYQLTTTF